MNTFVHDGDAVTIQLESAADVAARDALLARAMSANWKKEDLAEAARGPAAGRRPRLRRPRQSGRIVGTVRLWNIRPVSIRSAARSRR
jgi:predicted N-acetyltransferase YhbS